MSYSNDIKDKFIELRADGQTFGKISEQLSVPKSTLHRWADDHAEDILRYRRNEWADLEAQGRWRAEDLLLDLNCDLDRLEEHLRRFPVHHLSVRDTIVLMREKRRERDYLRSLLMGKDSGPRKSLAKQGDESNASQPSKEPTAALPLPVGEGRGEGQTSSVESSNSRSPVEIASTDLDKTERSQENGTTRPHNTNDLQQPECQSSHFVASETSAGGTSSIESLTSPQSLAGQQPSSAYAASDSDQPTSSLPQISASPRLCGKNASHQLPDELEPDDEFTGSTPYNPNECIQSILQKCLETERLHHETRSTSRN